MLASLPLLISPQTDKNRSRRGPRCQVASIFLTLGIRYFLHVLKLEPAARIHASIITSQVGIFQLLVYKTTNKQNNDLAWGQIIMHRLREDLAGQY